MMSVPVEKKWLSKKYILGRFDFSAATLWRHQRRGLFPLAKNFGGKIRRYDSDEISEYERDPQEWVRRQAARAA
jgi:hypothetical protein